MSDADTDPYAVVLADIDAQIKRLQIAKAAIEAIRGRGGPLPVAEDGPESSASLTSETSLGAGAFLGMTIVDATKKLLGIKRTALNNPAIATYLKAGGLVLNSNDPINTIGAVLTRRYNHVGDIVRVARGTWGLREWYPHTSFKKKLEQAPADSTYEVDAEKLAQELAELAREEDEQTASE
jgi:hypothetical protein